MNFINLFFDLALFQKFINFPDLKRRYEKLEMEEMWPPSTLSVSYD